MNKINHIINKARLNAIEIAVNSYLAGEIKDIIDSEWFTVFQVLSVVQEEIKRNEI